MGALKLARFKWWIFLLLATGAWLLGAYVRDEQPFGGMLFYALVCLGYGWFLNSMKERLLYALTAVALAHLFLFQALASQGGEPGAGFLQNYNLTTQLRLLLVFFVGSGFLLYLGPSITRAPKNIKLFIGLLKKNRRNMRWILGGIAAAFLVTWLFGRPAVSALAKKEAYRHWEYAKTMSKKPRVEEKKGVVMVPDYRGEGIFEAPRYRVDFCIPVLPFVLFSEYHYQVANVYGSGVRSVFFWWGGGLINLYCIMSWS